MTRGERFAVAVLALPASAAALAQAPTPLYVIVWFFLWSGGYIGDNDAPPWLDWVEWLSYILPALAFLAILLAAIFWVRGGSRANLPSR